MNRRRTFKMTGEHGTDGCPTSALFWQMWVLFLLTTTLLGQPRPRIDFDRLLRQFPNLHWEFEIRYLVHAGANADMLRIYYDGRADLVRWRPDNPGSLAEVCHGTIDDKQFRRLLELMRDKNFNELPSDSEPLRTIADTGDATISVRVGKTTVRKLDRHERSDPGLTAIENELDSIQKMIAADPKTKCGMESVPAKP